LIIGYKFKPSQGPGVRMVQRLKQLSRRHEHPRCPAHPPAIDRIDPKIGRARVLKKEEAPDQPALASP
jgi:hypothetical protein